MGSGCCCAATTVFGRQDDAISHNLPCSWSSDRETLGPFLAVQAQQLAKRPQARSAQFNIAWAGFLIKAHIESQARVRLIARRFPVLRSLSFATKETKTALESWLGPKQLSSRAHTFPAKHLAIRQQV